MPKHRLRPYRVIAVPTGAPSEAAFERLADACTAYFKRLVADGIISQHANSVTQPRENDQNITVAS